MHIFQLVQRKTPAFQMTIAETTPDYITVDIDFLYYLWPQTAHNPPDFSGDVLIEIAGQTEATSQEFSQDNTLSLSYSINLDPNVTHSGYLSFSDWNDGAWLQYEFDVTVLSSDRNYFNGTNDFNIVFGSGARDAIYGMSGDDVLNGQGGNDTLDGGSGEDKLYGGGGNDSLIGGTGNDTLVGGVGVDTAIYWSATGAIKVDLRVTGDQDIGGGQGTDMLQSIENIIGSEFDDILTGNNAANRIEGGAGNDRLVGNGGNDTLIGGLGSDTAGYGHATGGVRVNLTLSGSQAIGGGQGADQLISIENVNGSAFSDILTGNNAANMLNGGAGNDILIGNGGNDILNGGAGMDTAGYGQATAGVRVNLTLSGSQVIGGGQGADQLISIENVNGSAFSDILTGNNTANTLNGGAGNDILIGNGGNDTLNGGAGMDTAGYGQATAGVRVNLTLSGSQVIGGGQGADQLISIENVNGSAFADVLTGNSAANTLNGGAGNDVLNGNAGGDRLIGGLGADRLTGGFGADVFVFTSIAQSTTAIAFRDTITDFNRAQGDLIDVSQIDANTGNIGNQAFSFIGQADFSGRAGQLRYQLTSDGTLILGDVNGDRSADFAVFLDDRINLRADDFFL